MESRARNVTQAGRGPRAAREAMRERCDVRAPLLTLLTSFSETTGLARRT